jgi:transglutaminase-like putative cysteine protease
MVESVEKSRRLKVRHRTTYQYDRPIERSVHRFYLRPMHNLKQTLVSHSLQLDPATPVVEYEDVFGNWATRFELNEPYTLLDVQAESLVELQYYDPFAFTKLPKVPMYPVAWMPWERKLLDPFLYPPELPETQLRELFDYATSFVKRNDYKLMESLFDVNLTLFREFEYAPGSTNLNTTPYEVFQSRRGVCQDFTNLFICMARLLNLPARYVYGYVFTGNTGGDSRAQPDASHAWVEIYIPQIGWKALDPTHGVLPHRDHVRVGIGRNFRDCTPTSGMLFSPGVETMKVDVEITDVGDSQAL